MTSTLTLLEISEEDGYPRARLTFQYNTEFLSHSFNPLETERVDDLALPYARYFGIDK